MQLKDYLDDLLNEQEQTYIQQFWENEKMREAVRKVLLAGLYDNGTIKKEKKPNFLYNSALSLINADEAGGYPQVITNEQLGQKLRAYWEGLKVIENAFNAMSRYKKGEENPPKVGNPAR